MSTYTADRSTLVAALAECIEWTPELRATYETFGDLASAILSRLQPHAVQPIVSQEHEDLKAASEAAERKQRRRSAAAEAGRQLGQVTTAFDGKPAGLPVSPPRRVRKMAAAARKEAGMIEPEREPAPVDPELQERVSAILARYVA